MTRYSGHRPPQNSKEFEWYNVSSDHSEMKLEINNRKLSNHLEANNIFLNTLWIIGKVSREIKTFAELKENKNATYQNLEDTAKAVLREKLLSLNIFVIKEHKCEMKNASLSTPSPEKSKINLKQEKAKKY